MATYFGFAIGDGMFPSNCVLHRRPMAVEEVRDLVSRGDVISCLNPSHAATIVAARRRFGIAPEVPARAPRVSLTPGDQIIVMSVRGLPRLEGRHEYSDSELEEATFEFGVWTVG